jgi:hypothetical protein
MAQVMDILNKGSLAIRYAWANVTLDHLLPWSCCAYNHMLSEMQQVINKICTDVTGETTSEFMVTFIQSMTGDLLTMTCKKYSPVKNCDKLLPESVDVFHEIFSHPASKVPEQKYTFLTHLMHVFNRLV